MLQEGHFAIVSGEEGVAAVQDLVTADPVVATRAEAVEAWASVSPQLSVVITRELRSSVQL